MAADQSPLGPTFFRPSFLRPDSKPRSLTTKSPSPRRGLYPSLFERRKQPLLCSARQRNGKRGTLKKKGSSSASNGLNSQLVQRQTAKPWFEKTSYNFGGGL